MDEKEQDHVAAFDILFTTNQIQIMKILLPCFTPSIQKYLAIYIKQQELQYTISCLKNHTLHTGMRAANKQESIRKLLPEILPYCNESQSKIVHQLEQIFSSLESYQEIMEMMEMMQTMQGMSESSDASGMPFDMTGGQMPDMEMLMALLGPEQQNFMEMLKGGITHE